VVLTAHVDHEGLGEEKNGDAIYNGALDNASGTAAMLEVARAFTSLPSRPRRSILFIGTAAEEEGLLGADYFANFPTVPLSDIVADVNLDGSASWYPPAEMIAFGAAHSTLSEDARSSAAMLDLRIIDDPHPEQAFFIRSDQYPFIKKGVPSLFFMIGEKSTDPNRDGAAMFERYLTTLYHTPQDDMSQGLDFAACATIARLHFLTAYRIAQADRRPSWKRGDFFGERFGRK
jgi:Zn-dependent M28 family amino/carboxypeptidase